MGNYLVEIEGKHVLEQIKLMISGEEAGASEFISSALSFYEGRITNLATFKELPPGIFPKQLTLLPHNTPQPPGTKLVWSGGMLVKDTNTAISAYRTT